jgi:3-hexulose-6-phosphate synthase/6-phospho-3-hexuloisomerase
MQKPPILQVALDFVDLHRAMKVAEEAVAGGADWLEAGTPLIKSEGLNVVRRLREAFPSKTIVADMKTMDAGRAEMETASKAGANVAIVLGAASDSTIRECIEAGHNYGIEVGVDLICVSNFLERAMQVEKWGASHVGIHTAIDDQMKGIEPFDKLRKICSKVNIPVAVAGGINSETVVDAVNAGAQIIIVGGAITKAKEARKATENIREAIKNRKKVPTELFKRASKENVKNILEKVSTANISDGSHRLFGITDLQPVFQNIKIIGRAVTVRTYPGDWAKPVEAIDVAGEGDVIVIDAGGLGPAVWGELATRSAIQRKLAGVVINGAIRDVTEIRRLKFPAFTKLIMPNAGEPKGFGEINIPITISGVRIKHGDWIVGDDDGLMVVPEQNAEEMTNHAMDWLEKENRIREEIQAGATSLGKVIDILKWEKK